MKAYMSWSSRGYKQLSKNSLDYKMFKLSLHLLRLQFAEVILITDCLGQECLKDLPFTRIETSLDNKIPGDYQLMWALSKIVAYKEIVQKGDPFIHIDNDVFLFGRLTHHVLYSPLITQHKETKINNIYGVENFINAIPNKYYFNSKQIDYCANFGIFGGTDLEFIDFYATEAMKVALDPENKQALCRPEVNHFHPSVMVEQYYFCLLAELFDKKISYLLGEDFKEDSKKVGYTHLWGAKTNSDIDVQEKLDKTLHHYNL